MTILFREAVIERASDCDLIVKRSFDAPAQAVFDAWTQPDLLKRWWAPRSWGVTLFECESDLRVGGSYKFVFGRDRKGAEVFTGRYDVVENPSRLVLTQIYERFREAGAVVVTISFEELNGETLVTLHQQYPSKGALDGAIATGMERGLQETLNQLDVLMRELS